MIHVLSFEINKTLVDTLLELIDCDSFTPTCFHDVESDLCRVEVFFEHTECEQEIREALANACALIGFQPRFNRSQLKRSDWTESWKRFFRVERISPRIVIRPLWESFTPAPHDCVITIDPGMSFGTGKHATTRACLLLLDELAARQPLSSFLDMGCGSGILSIGAALLGCTEVRGFDIDPDSVRIADENARLNALNLNFYHADLQRPHPPARTVTANILAPVLIEYAGSIADSVEQHPDARLILSGILDSQYDEVRTEFQKTGFAEMRSVLIDEWRSGVFTRG